MAINKRSRREKSTNTNYKLPTHSPTPPSPDARKKDEVNSASTRSNVSTTKSEDSQSTPARLGSRTALEEAISDHPSHTSSQTRPAVEAMETLIKDSDSKQARPSPPSTPPDTPSPNKTRKPEATPEDQSQFDRPLPPSSSPTSPKTTTPKTKPPPPGAPPSPSPSPSPPQSAKNLDPPQQQNPPIHHPDQNHPYIRVGTKPPTDFFRTYPTTLPPINHPSLHTPHPLEPWERKLLAEGKIKFAKPTEEAAAQRQRDGNGGFRGWLVRDVQRQSLRHIGEILGCLRCKVKGMRCSFTAIRRPITSREEGSSKAITTNEDGGESDDGSSGFGDGKTATTTNSNSKSPTERTTNRNPNLPTPPPSCDRCIRNKCPSCIQTGYLNPINQDLFLTGGRYRAHGLTRAEAEEYAIDLLSDFGVSAPQLGVCDAEGRNGKICMWLDEDSSRGWMRDKARGGAAAAASKRHGRRKGPSGGRGGDGGGDSGDGEECGDNTPMLSSGLRTGRTEPRPLPTWWKLPSAEEINIIPRLPPDSREFLMAVARYERFRKERRGSENHALVERMRERGGEHKWREFLTEGKEVGVGFVPGLWRLDGGVRREVLVGVEDGREEFVVRVLGEVDGEEDGEGGEEGSGDGGSGDGESDGVEGEAEKMTELERKEARVKRLMNGMTEEEVMDKVRGIFDWDGRRPSSREDS